MLPPIEENGQLLIFANLNTTLISQNATGTSLFYSYGVRLQTNDDQKSFNSSGKLNGLGIDSFWSIGASFIPLLPSLGSDYQIRFTDSGIGSNSGNGDDSLQLMVRGAIHGPQLRLSKQNFLAGTATELWAKDITIPADATQIDLGFAHLNAGSTTINAYYSFSDISGASIFSEAILTTGSIFSGENLTRFELRAATPVSEPTRLALWVSGLGAMSILLVRRRREIYNTAEQG